MASDAQIVFRVETSHKVALEAAALALGVPSSEIMRNMLEEQLPQLRKEADAATAKNENLPQGVTLEQVEQAAANIMRTLARKQPVELHAHQMLAPTSKALWVLLGFLWDDYGGEASERVASLLSLPLPDQRPKS